MNPGLEWRFLLVAAFLWSGVFAGPAGTSHNNVQLASSRTKMKESILERVLEESHRQGQGLPTDVIQELVEVLDCECVDGKCQCITGSNKKPAMAPGSNQQPAGLSDEEKQMHPYDRSGRDDARERGAFQALVSDLGCECAFSKCKCAPSSLPRVKTLLDRYQQQTRQLDLDGDLVEIDVMIQRSIGAKIKQFFNEGFRRLKQTFTRTPHLLD